MAIVALAGFFPVLVNTAQGLRAADDVLLDRMRVLNASWMQTFWQVRLPFALPRIRFQATRKLWGAARTAGTDAAVETAAD